MKKTNKKRQKLPDSSSTIVDDAQADAQKTILEGNFEQIVAASPDAILVHIDRKIIYANPAAAKSLKAESIDKLVGLNLDEFTHEGMEPETAKKLWALSKDQVSSPNQRERLRCLDGSELDVEVTVARLMNGDGEAFMCHISDVTRRRSAETINEQLLALGPKMSAVTSGEEAAHEIATAAKELMGWDACNIGVVSKKNGLLRVIYLADTFEDGVRQIQPEETDFERKPSLLCQKILNRGTLLVKSRKNVSWLKKSERFGNIEKVAQEIAAVTFQLPGGKEVGILSLQSYQENCYTTESLKYLQILADYCAAALARAEAQEALHRNEQSYRKIFQSAPYGIVIHDGEKIFFGNEAAAAIAGLAGSNLRQGLDITKTLDFTTWEIAKKRIDKIKKNKTRLTPFEYNVKDKRGRSRRIEATSMAFDYDDKPAIVSFGRDVTERYRADQLNSTLQELGRRLAGSSSPYEAANEIASAAQKLLPYEALEFSVYNSKIGHLIPILILDTDNAGELREYPRKETKEPSPLFWQVIESEGLIIHQEPSDSEGDLKRFGEATRRSESMLLVPLLDGEQNPFGILALHSYERNLYSNDDLTILKTLAAYSVSAVTRTTTQKELAERERLYREVIRSIYAVAYHRSLKDRRYIYIDPQIEELSGYTLEEFTNTPAPNKILSIEMLAPYEGMKYEDVKELYHKGEISSMSTLYEWETKQGERRLISDHAILIKDELGEPVSSLGILQDITNERNARKEIQRQRAFLKSVIDMNPGPIWVKDLEGKYILANEMSANLVNKTAEELIGLSDNDLVLNDEKRYYFSSTDQQAIDEKRDVVLYDRIEEEEGDVQYFTTVKRPLFNESGEVTNLLGVGTNVTAIRKIEEERSKLEKRMESALRLESLGMLAGGIAHDFNNLLVGILGNAGLALLKAGEKSEIREPLKLIEQTAQQASELANRLLIYSGKSKPTIESYDLHRVVKDVIKLTSVNLGNSTKIILENNVGDSVMEGDSTQIRQIVLNLITNAIDALTEAIKPGSINVSLHRYLLVKEDLEEIIGSKDMLPGSYICLKVSDEGAGISEEHIDRIFDPFFTTKEKGHGLGLAAVLGSLQSHGGGVKVESRQGHGSTFQIFLPEAMTTPSATKPLPISNTTGAVTPKQKADLVVVVDDEEIVRDVAEAMLLQLGFQCLLFEDGEQLSSYLESASESEIPKIIILDMNLPGISGWETLTEIRKSQSELPVLISSGYHELEPEMGEKDDPNLTLFPKPYRIEELAQVLQKIQGTE